VLIGVKVDWKVG